MRREELKALLPVMQAFAAGEEVQYENWKNCWKDADTPCFHARDDKGKLLNWRIKPKPREVWVASGGKYVGLNIIGLVGDEGSREFPWVEHGTKISKFREVLD